MRDAPPERLGRRALVVRVEFPRASKLSEQIEVLLAIAVPLGLSPIAPATVASAATVAVIYFFFPLAGGVRLLLASGLLLLLGVRVATTAERVYGYRDPRAVVIDEVVGQMLTLAFHSLGWQGAIAGFLLFRCFDILKPYPVRTLERIPAGWGIMADDVAAGIYANLSLWVLGYLWKFAPLHPGPM